MKKISFILASLCAAISAHAQIYDAVADFDISNPNGGHFNYGYVVNGQTTFNSFTDIALNFIDTGLPTGLNEFGTTPQGDTVPGLIQNPNAAVTLLNSAQYYMPANSLMIYPDGNTLTDVRFIAPTTGTYNILAVLDRTGYVGSMTAGYLIFKNVGQGNMEYLDGNQTYFSNENLYGTFQYENTFLLQAGDTIDLLTVAGSGPVGVNLTATVPEPSTWAFLMLGSSLIGVISWKRRRIV